MVEAAGIEPVEAATGKAAPTPQMTTYSLQNNTLTTTPNPDGSHKTTRSTQANNKYQQPKCVPGVYPNLPADLAKVIEAWPTLSEACRRQIVKITVESSST